MSVMVLRTDYCAHSIGPGKSYGCCILCASLCILQLIHWPHCSLLRAVTIILWMRITWTSLMLSWSPSNCTSTGNLVDNLAQRKLQWYVAVLWLRQWVSLVCFPYGPWWVHTSGVGVSIGGWADAAACQRCVHCEGDSRTFFTSLLWGLDPS